jgi:hypothetical protein
MTEDLQFIKTLADLELNEELHKASQQLVRNLGEHIDKLMQGNFNLPPLDPAQRDLFWYGLVTAGYLESWRQEAKVREIVERMALEGWDRSFLEAMLPICREVMESHFNTEIDNLNKHFSKSILIKSVQQFIYGGAILALGISLYFFFPFLYMPYWLGVIFLSVPFFIKGLAGVWEQVFPKT